MQSPEEVTGDGGSQPASYNGGPCQRQLRLPRLKQTPGSGTLGEEVAMSGYGQMGDATWQEYLLGPRKFCIRLGLKVRFHLFQNGSQILCQSISRKPFGLGQTFWVLSSVRPSILHLLASEEP